MSNAAATPATGAAAMYRALVGIGSICALLIVTAYLLTGCPKASFAIAMASS